MFKSLQTVRQLFSFPPERRIISELDKAGFQAVSIPSGLHKAKPFNCVLSNLLEVSCCSRDSRLLFINGLVMPLGLSPYFIHSPVTYAARQSFFNRSFQ